MVYGGPLSYLSSLTGGYAPQGQQQQPDADPFRARMRAILEQLQQPQEAAPSRFQDLPAEERRPADTMGLLSLAQAIGGAPMGELGTALAAGVQQREIIRQHALEQYQQDMTHEQAAQRGGVEERLRIAQLQRELNNDEVRAQRDDQAARVAPPDGIDPALWHQLDPGERLRYTLQARQQTATAQKVEAQVPNLRRASAARGGDPDMAEQALRSGLSPFEALKQSLPEKGPAAPRWEPQHVQDADGNLYWADPATRKLSPMMGPSGPVKGRVPGAAGDSGVTEGDLRVGALKEAQRMLERQVVDPKTGIDAITGKPALSFDDALATALSHQRAALAPETLGADPGASAMLTGGAPPAAPPAKALVRAGADGTASPYRGPAPEQKTATNKTAGMPADLYSLTDGNKEARATAAKLRGMKNPATGKLYTWDEITALVHQSMAKAGLLQAP